MYAVEFQAIIENGVVHIPKEYKDLQEKREVRFFIMYDDSDKHKTNVENRKKRKKGSGIGNNLIPSKYFK